jgi:hypothetical protein
MKKPNVCTGMLNQEKSAVNVQRNYRLVYRKKTHPVLTPLKTGVKSS